jgi:hypothetical protein
MDQASRLRAEAGQLQRMVAQYEARELAEAGHALLAILRDLRTLADRLESAASHLPGALAIGENGRPA